MVTRGEALAAAVVGGLTLAAAFPPWSVPVVAPLGVGASPADLVRTVRYILATPSLTGAMIVVDGGEHLGKPATDVQFRK